jgi:hypothetical protein
MCRVTLKTVLIYSSRFDEVVHLLQREALQRDVDRERRLRLDTEVRLRDSTGEAERCRARLASLQREFSR